MQSAIRKRLPHEIPQWVSEGSLYFLTLNCAPRGRNHLCRAGLGDTILQAATFYHEQRKWHCRLILLMPDHLHAIVAFPREPGMKSTVMNWKRYLARNHQVSWQRDFFEHRLRDDHELDD